MRTLSRYHHAESAILHRTPHPVGIAALVAVATLAVIAFALVGCAPTADTPAIEQQIGDGALVAPRTLTVGVNIDSAPYAVKSGKGYVGTDAEYASEIARLLGLQVHFVNIAPDQMSTAVAAGTVDMVMSAPVSLVESASTGSAETTVVAPYLSAGSAIYAKTSAGSPDLDVTEADLPIAAQTGSPAYWTAVHRYGTDAVKAYPSAAEALQAVADGTLTYAVVDSVVGSYAISQSVAVSRVGWLTDPADRGIGVLAGKGDVVSAVARVAGELRVAGWTDALLRRWLMPVSEGGNADQPGAVEASSTSAP